MTFSIFRHIQLQQQEIEKKSKLVTKLEAKLAAVENKYEQLEQEYNDLQRSVPYLGCQLPVLTTLNCSTQSSNSDIPFYIKYCLSHRVTFPRTSLVPLNTEYLGCRWVMLGLNLTNLSKLCHFYIFTGTSLNL